MSEIIPSLRNVYTSEDGATMVEYGLMVALIAVVSLTAVSLLGTNLKVIFQQIAAAV